MPPPSKLKSHVAKERPPFGRIALLLQGGGALGAYQARCLCRAVGGEHRAGLGSWNIDRSVQFGPDRRQPAGVARGARLREFWEEITGGPLGIPLIEGEIKGDYLHQRHQSVSRDGAFFSPARRISSNHASCRHFSTRRARSKP